MGHVNVEIKAYCSDLDAVREILRSNQARFQGTDHQVDTYFRVPTGRLKLREGNIENHLIYYEREDKAGPKQSNVTLFKTDPQSSLKEILIQSLGVLIIVDKHREIYWIDNVKFHLDNVAQLGSFVEIEAVDYQRTIGATKLFEQCQQYCRLFQILESAFVSQSYSDALLNRSEEVSQK